jgi:hypothetical protein
MQITIYRLDVAVIKFAERGRILPCGGDQIREPVLCHGSCIYYLKSYHVVPFSAGISNINAFIIGNGRKPKKGQITVM